MKYDPQGRSRLLFIAVPAKAQSFPTDVARPADKLLRIRNAVIGRGRHSYPKLLGTADTQRCRGPSPRSVARTHAVYVLTDGDRSPVIPTFVL